MKDGSHARSEGCTSCCVRSPRKEEGLFTLETNRGAFESESLVVATGGLSIPKLGATDFGYRVARQFGLKVLNPTPALVPFTLARGDLDAFKNLSGVSVHAAVSAGGA